MPAERPHRYYSSEEMLERIAELEAELLAAQEEAERWHRETLDWQQAKDDTPLSAEDLDRAQEYLAKQYRAEGLHPDEAIPSEKPGSEDEARKLLRRIREWDQLPDTADGPYWIAEIDRLLDAD